MVYLPSMPQIIEGTLSARGLRFAIVASRFNALIVEPLIAGALDAIVRSGGDADAVTIVRCPGAWELPQVARRVIARGGIDAVVALGAVIRGATPHFDYVAGEAAHGLAGAAATADVAVSFGVLTTDTIEQALERAGSKAGNKGFDAALAAIELATLFRALSTAPGAPAGPNERTKRSPGRHAGGAVGPEQRSEGRSEGNDPAQGGGRKRGRGAP
jgi:6,7-dimethyl-8-ribityllumazine synthase